MARLRHMTASVNQEKRVVVMLATGEIVELSNAFVLTSYNSRVAIYDGERVYLLPRYAYSRTTCKHLHAFIADYCCAVNDYSIPDLRKMLAAYEDNPRENENGEYIKALGIIDFWGDCRAY